MEEDTPPRTPQRAPGLNAESESIRGSADLSISQIRQELESGSASPSWIETLEHDPRKGVGKLLEIHRRNLQRNSLEVRRMEAAYESQIQMGRRHGGAVGGVDEVGRGPLAGPVVAACVILADHPMILGLNDSKVLSKARRETLDAVIRGQALGFGFGIVDSKRIDQINIYQAAREAMMAAVQTCRPELPRALILDAMKLPGIPLPQLAIPKADATRACVMAASIIAKVARDKMMEDFDRIHPGYNFSDHKGYGTAHHLDRIRELGVSPIHRLTFAGPAEADPDALANLYRTRLEGVRDGSTLNRLGQEIRRRAEALGPKRLAILRVTFRNVRDRLNQSPRGTDGPGVNL